MKRSHIIALLFIAASIGVIVTMVGSSLSYATFQEAADHNGQEFHIIGTLDDDKTMYYDPIKDPNYFSFHMVDTTGYESEVIYLNTKPPDFEMSEQIVVVGKMKDDKFHATSVLSKCPSKYVPEDIGEAEPKSEI